MSFIEKRQNITKMMMQHMKIYDTYTIDCIGTQNVYMAMQAAIVVANQLHRPPFTATSTFITKYLNNKTATGISITFKSELPKEMPNYHRPTSNSIMELELWKSSHMTIEPKMTKTKDT